MQLADIIYQEMHQLEKVLKQFLKRPFKKRVTKTGIHLTMPELQDRLLEAGVCTKTHKSLTSGQVLRGGKKINKGTLYRWLSNL